MNPRTSRLIPRLVASLLVALMLISTLAACGGADTDNTLDPGGPETAVSSENFTLTRSQLNVLRYEGAYSQATVSAMYAAYGIDMYGLAHEYDLNKVFEQLQYMSACTQHIMRNGLSTAAAVENAKQLLALCEGARHAGVYDALRSKAAADVQLTLDGVRETAEQIGLSFSEYLARHFGEKVTEDDLKTLYTYRTIACMYSEQLRAELAEKLTEEELSAYREQNRESFYAASYHAIQLESEKLYSALKNYHTRDEVKAAIIQHYFAEAYDSAIELAFNGNPPEDAEQTRNHVYDAVLSLHGMYEAAEGAFSQAIMTAAEHINGAGKQDSIAGIFKRMEGEPTSSAYISSNTTGISPVQKWLFDAARRPGDAWVLEETRATQGQVQTVHTLYIMEKPLAPDEEPAPKVAYLTIPDDESAPEEILRLYNALKDITEPEAFLAKARELTEDLAVSRVGIGMTSTSSKLDTEWVTADKRVPGDMTYFQNGKNRILDAVVKSRTTTAAETETEIKQFYATINPSTDIFVSVQTGTLVSDVQILQPGDVVTIGQGISAPSVFYASASLDVCNNFILLYCGKGEPQWMAEARDRLSGERVAEWVEAACATYGVTVSSDVHIPEDTASTILPVG